MFQVSAFPWDGLSGKQQVEPGDLRALEQHFLCGATLAKRKSTPGLECRRSKTTELGTGFLTAELEPTEVLGIHTGSLQQSLGKGG